jgi:hypothetical protein
MKKYSTKYFEWATCLTLNLFLVGALAFAVHFGFSYKKQTLVDLMAIALPLVALLVLGLALWETIITFNFLIKDVKGHVIIETSGLKIIRSKGEEIYPFKDLIEIQFVGPLDGSRSVTSKWTYTKLTFKKEVLFLTSLTIDIAVIQKELRRLSAISKFRNRRYFEFIK